MADLDKPKTTPSRAAVDRLTKGPSRVRDRESMSAAVDRLMYPSNAREAAASSRKGFSATTRAVIAGYIAEQAPGRVIIEGIEEGRVGVISVSSEPGQSEEADMLLDSIERRLTVEETLTQQLLERYGLSA